MKIQENLQKKWHLWAITSFQKLCISHHLALQAVKYHLKQYRSYSAEVFALMYWVSFNSQFILSLMAPIICNFFYGMVGRMFSFYTSEPICQIPALVWPLHRRPTDYMVGGHHKTKVLVYLNNNFNLQCTPTFLVTCIDFLDVTLQSNLDTGSVYLSTFPNCVQGTLTWIRLAVICFINKSLNSGWVYPG